MDQIPNWAGCDSGDEERRAILGARKEKGGWLMSGPHYVVREGGWASGPALLGQSEAELGHTREKGEGKGKRAGLLPLAQSRFWLWEKKKNGLGYLWWWAEKEKRESFENKTLFLIFRT
jgi:hypothetical protein